MDDITASYETLMNQAPSTVELYMLEGANIIEKQFGQGYAFKHPELLSAFIIACSNDFATACITKAIQQCASEIGFIGD